MRLVDVTRTINIEKIAGKMRGVEADVVIAEYPFTIHINDKELVTLLCSPTHLEYLALGFLQSEGFIQDGSSIKNIEFDEEKGYINVHIYNGERILNEKAFGKRTLTTGCGKGTTFHDVAQSLASDPIHSKMMISTEKVFEFVNQLHESAQIFRKTGGAHISTLASEQEMMFVHEDIGRHNALDKLFGECIMKDVGFEDKIIITSGRISSEMLIKSAKRRIPILISRSAATQLSIELAQKAGVTLIGFVRNDRMNIYTNGWRIV